MPSSATIFFTLLAISILTMAIRYMMFHPPPGCTVDDYPHLILCECGGVLLRPAVGEMIRCADCGAEHFEKEIS